MSENQKIYVVGHKNPDTDSICSAISYAELKRKVDGDAYIAKRAGNVNEETQFVLDYFGVEAPEYLADLAETDKIILVDHNETSQAVDGLEKAEIMEVIDHHKIGNIETPVPIYFRNQPVGCTATIVYQMYKENVQEVTKEIAGLLCSAIISDTLMFRSPTCTPVDKETAMKLAEIAGINDIEAYAMDMFKAGSNLADKTPEEIFFQDFKKFEVNGVNFGVGQISSMATEELFEIADRLKPYMATALEEQGVDMIFFMLTSILDESTNLIFTGEKAGELVEKAYQVSCEAGDYYKLEGVVSRKKQLIPSFMGVLQ